MKKTLNVSRKVLSVFLAILMVLTSWVWLPGEHNHASAAAVRGTPAIRGSAYTGSTGAYGSSLFNGNLDRWFKFHNKNSDYVQIHYPSHIYLDKSETLQSAGYYFNVDWAFGNSSDYRILIGANALGDNSQWTGYPDKYYTMTNVFNNYGFDASVPSGGSKIVYNTSVGGTDYDLRIVGYGHSTQGSDGFSYDGTRHDRYVLFRSYSGNPNTATIYLMGTPNGTYDNKEYNTTGNSMGSYGFQQNLKDKKWKENNNSMFKQKSYDAANDGCSSYYEGQYAEMQWFVTVYDKSALNSTINSKTLADSESVKYTQASWNAYKTALNNAKTVLTSRETTQTNIDNAKKELESKYNALIPIYTVNFNLPVDVTPISPKKFESGAYLGENLPVPTTRPGYKFLRWYVDNNGNGIYDSSEEVTDGNGNVVDSLKKFPITQNWVLEADWINQYTVTFNFANGTSDTQTYDYGTTITVPSNSTKQSDATNHYTYTWTPSVATTVTGDATYNEVLSTEAHNWGDWTEVLAGDCLTNGTEERKCTVCDYTERKNTGLDNTVHNDTADFAQTDATCTADGYTAGTYCYNCNQWISGHEIIPAAHTLVHVDAKAPSCTDDGTIEYWSCSKCSKKFSDADAKTEITSVVDVAKGHTPGESATCTAPQICTVCGTALAPKLGHTEATREEVISEATCGKDGSYNVVTYCSVCSEVISTETKTSPATGNHTLGDWIVDKGATCVTPGSQHKECEDCDYIKTETIPATGVHAYGEWSQYGNKHRRVCTLDINCSAAEEEAHNFNGALRQMDGGNFHQYKCEKCDAYGVGTQMNIGEACYGEGTAFTPIDGNDGNHKEICKCGREKNDAHALVKVDDTYKAPECEATGEQGWKCTECNYEFTETLGAKGHKMVAGEVIAPTCTDDGYTVYTCENGCGTTENRDIVATSGHKYDKVVTDPTCTAEGYTTYTCSVCGDSYVGDKVTASGHKAGADATCITAQTCTVCGVELVGILGHKYDSVVTKPTCTDKGFTTHTCSVCGDTYVDTYVDALGHTPAEAVKEKEVPSTCTVAGSYDSVVYCSVCNVEISRKEVEIPINAAAHTGTATVVKNDKAATCTEEGYTGDIHWSCCGALETKGTAIAIDKDAHTTEETYVDGYVAPTCTTPGATGDTKYKCCNAVKVASTEIPVDATAHTGEANVVKNDKAATCTEEGYTGDIHWSCCGALETKGTVIAIDKDAHTTEETYVDGYVAPTCTTPGATGDTKYKCCNAVKVASTEIPVDATAHTGEANVVKNEKAATCTTEGYTGDTYWSCCDTLKTKGTVIAIDKDAHTTEETYVDGYVAPTCTAAGATGDTKYKCCNAVKVASTEIPVDATAHTGEANVVKNEKAATCTAEGYTGDTYWSCCDALKTKGEAIAKLSHTQATREENRVEASCGADGSYDLVTYCSVCQTVLGSEKVTIPATGAHNYVTEVEGSRVPATCIAEGTVTFKCGCGATKDEILEIDPDNHEGYNEKVSETPSTCNTKGSVTMKCACGDEKTTALELDASNHESIVTDKAVEPTCTVPGKTEGSHCSACNTVLVEQTEIPASGKHTYGDPVLTKAPSANEPGEYTETCTACGDTVITKVFFADYSKLNEVAEQLNRLLNNNTDLTDAAEQILKDAIAEAEGIDKNLVADVTTAGGKEIKGGQDTIDALVAKLSKVVDDTTDAIHNGSALVPDYSAWDAAVADYNKVDKTRVMQKYLDEAAALMADIATKKENTAHTQASATQAEINAATKRLNEITYYINLNSYVNPDFLPIESAIAEYDALTPATSVLDSIAAEIAEIKNTYAEIKGNADANEYAHQGQLNALTARVNEIIACITDTSLIKPDYADATAALNTVKALAEANELLNGVANDISDIETKLNKIINNASSNMKADQQAVDALDTELNALIKDITDGKLVKPDYSAADEAIANTDNISILTDEEKTKIDGLKNILNSIKTNEASNKYDDQITVNSIANQINGVYDKYKDCLPDNHDYTVKVVDPLCGEDGYTEYTCNRCGYSYKDNFITATTEHDWDEGVLTRPTATTDGYYTYTCMNPACGATKTEKVERADYGKYNEAVSELNDLINSGKLTDKAKAEADAALNDAKITDGYITSEQGYVDAATTVIESIYAAVGNDEANFKPDFSEVNGLLDKYVEISSKVEIPEDVKSEINKIIEEIYAIIDDSSSNKKDHQSVVDGLADTLKNLITVYEDCANGIHRDNDDDTLCDHCGQEYIKGADGCFCHKDNIISKIVRLIYSCISWLFGKKISCCPDMEFYFKGIGSLT